MYKKNEYQSLECPEYTITQKPVKRFVLCALFLVQLLVLLLWLYVLIEKSKEIDSISELEDNDLESENSIFVEMELPDDGHKQSPMWESNIDDMNCTVVSDSEKFDCFPESWANELSCGKRGCCWDPNNNKSVGVPSCYYPNKYGGYKLLRVSHSKHSMVADLQRTFSSPYPDDVKFVQMVVEYQKEYRIHIKITDGSLNRYEPPYPEISPTKLKNLKNPLFQFMFDSDGFKILRKNQSVLLEHDNAGGFIFADQFLQLSLKYHGKIYGLGEHQASLQLNTNWTKFTFFNRDGIPQPQTNLYGSQPFYLVLEDGGDSHGVFFHNSNAMDVILQPLPAITFRSIGGVFDFYIFLGPTPGDVVKQFTELVGYPFLPPYWSLGFHLSRLGYKNTSHIRAVWSRTRSAGIPFDTQWHDIDYMSRRNDFTIDKANYWDLKDFLMEIQHAGMHYVPIVDPGISGCEPQGTYRPYDDGVKMNVFVKNQNGSIFVGKVWNPNCTVFPDFTAPQATTYWFNQLNNFYKLIPFDGIWIDMNEPSNFIDGGIDGCPSNKWENPPFTPNVSGGKLSSLTLCMSACHAAGLHYNLHNLYGLTEAISTFQSLEKLGKRPFIISRATYPGIGKYAGHWSGDVTSTWESMRASIPKMLSFSLFGVPMMGADICGFNLNTTTTLCERWSQLGAFYPFSRNHNSDDCIDQDPVALGEDVVKSAKKALMVRYALLPYLYTLFYNAHAKGETVARPLFFEFWNDPRTHDLDRSFLWGCCVLIVPVLDEFATTVSTYLPKGRWYDWYTGLGMESNGTDVVLPAASDTIPVFLRGGAVIPTQAPNVTTTLSRDSNIVLYAAFNSTLGGSGSLYWDDGKTKDKTVKYGLVHFTLNSESLTSHVKIWKYGGVSPTLGSIKILGFIKPIRRIYFNDKEVKYEWDSKTLVLSVDVKFPIKSAFTLKWIFITE